MDTSKPTHIPINTKAPSCVDDGHFFKIQNLRQHGQQKLKRRVRRSTNKLYQERPMNMTEARKEIASALKYHRATMKLENEHQQLQLHQQHESSSFQPSFYSSFSPDGRFYARRRPKMYPPYSNKISHYLNDFSFLSPFPPSLLLFLFLDLLFLLLFLLLLQFQTFTPTQLHIHFLNHPLS